MVALDERGHLCWSEIRGSRETAVELKGEGGEEEGVRRNRGTEKGERGCLKIFNSSKYMP